MGVKGRLADIGLVDIIQIFISEGKTMALHLSSEMGFGHIYIKDGRVVHASYRDAVGAEALRQLMAWKDGEFEVDTEAVAQEETIGEEAGVFLYGGSMDKAQDQGAGAAAYEDDSVSLIKRLLNLGILEKV